VQLVVRALRELERSEGASDRPSIMPDGRRSTTVTA